MLELQQNPDWMEYASCSGLDPDLWFPERGKQPTKALKVCAVCPVSADCLEYALKEGLRAGVFGGTTERQRRKLRGQRARGET